MHTDNWPCIYESIHNCQIISVGNQIIAEYLKYDNVTFHLMNTVYTKPSVLLLLYLCVLQVLILIFVQKIFHLYINLKKYSQYRHNNASYQTCEK